MAEHQTVEYKSVWRDEYLKWLCGYANASGGRLYVGKDDNGKVIGVENAKKLLEDLPNKITSSMGIIADVNLRYEEDLPYIEIVVDRYPSMISYHGKYYYRSGSTMREITGRELDERLLKAQGRTWDGIPLPNFKIADLKPSAVELFKKKSIERGRLSEDDVNVSDKILMEDLHLIDDDGYLNRAAMLAFYKDPEKWVTGAYIKIGYFESTDSNLRYQDEIHGPLIEQIDKTIDLVYTKYMKAFIEYKGVQRIERFMFNPDAFREILLNAVVHKDYSGCTPIQISVYEDRLYVWNDGRMPENLNTTEKLFAKHSSKPFNPKLAEIFFKSGMIEAWGRGFDKISEACAKYNSPLPEYTIDDSGIMVCCNASEDYIRLLNDTATKDVGKDVGKELSRIDIQLLQELENNPYITTAELGKALNITTRTVERHIKALKESDIIKRTGGRKSGKWILSNPKATK